MKFWDLPKKDLQTLQYQGNVVHQQFAKEIGPNTWARSRSSWATRSPATWRQAIRQTDESHGSGAAPPPRLPPIGLTARGCAA